MSEHEYEELMRLRSRILGVDEPCKACGGLGRRMYGSTSTWRGGIGGQAMTIGLCDKCWGSGDATRPFTNIRNAFDEYRRQVDNANGELFAKRIGCGGLSDMKPAIDELCAILDDLSSPRKRKVRAQWFDMLCGVVSIQLKKCAGGE